MDKSVVRKKGGTTELISQFYGEEAPWLSEIFDNYQSPLYMTMPKGLGLTEAKENFKKYMNDIADEQ